MLLTDGDVRYWLQTGLFIILFLSAFRWGGGPEKVLAGVLVWFRVGDAANHALIDILDLPFAADTGHFVIDLIAAVVALAVAAHANRMYPLWFAAFQLLAVFAHLARELAPGVALLAYRLMYVGPSYFQIMLLAGGIWLHRRRVLRHGPYRSWRSSSPRSPAPARSSWPNG